MPYHQNSAGHGGGRWETDRKTEIEIHGYHQKRHQEKWADRRQHSRPQELEIGSVEGDPLTWKSLQGEKKELHCVFVNLEKAYDKVPRKEVWYCMRKYGLAEKYVRIVQDMYDDSTTAVRCALGVTEGFEVKVGLHQGSALILCLFAMVMDRMTDEIREEASWTMMFADDIVICSESKEQVEDKLDSWRYALERRGMKVNRRKTYYIHV